MSISLSIRWPDGSFEDVAIASQRGGEWWGEVGRELGLELLPHFHSFIPVERERLDQLAGEVKTFRKAIEKGQPTDTETLKAADRLLDAFERLKQSEGWRASIG